MPDVKPEISVVICTHNPDPKMLGAVVDAIGAQENAPPYELILIDNCSEPPVDKSVLRPGGGLRHSCIREYDLGLSRARRTGIEAARGELICFVDDDNILASDYLAEAFRIAQTEPELGVIGGQSLGAFSKQPDWLCRHFLARYAIRSDEEPVTISMPERHVRAAEPFGAGMIVRRPVAQSFSELVSAFNMDLPMGRKGTALGSGEDTLFSHIAYGAGYQTGYRPTLVLQHVIADDRLHWRYLRRLLEGQAKGEALLDQLDGIAPPIPDTGAPGAPARSAIRFLKRVRSVGLAEAIGLHFWDRGYVADSEEIRLLAARLSSLLAETKPPAPPRPHQNA